MAIFRTRVCFIGAALLFATGCVSAMVEREMAKHGYKRASREQMLRPMTPSFQRTAPKKEMSAFPKEKLHGKWTSSYVIDSRSSLLSMGYDGPTQTMSAHQTYWFFEDGSCRTLLNMAGKENSWNGNWDYRNGILTISGMGGDGKHYSTDLKLYWYDANEFGSRFASLPDYEAMLSKPEGVKSVSCSYESNGILHTQMIISAQGNESAVISVQSPQIFERESDSK